MSAPALAPEPVVLPLRIVPAPEPRPRALRVVVADAHPVVRAGLRDLLARAHGAEPVGEARDSAEAARLAARVRPDVVVMDLPDADAVARVAGAAPDSRVLVLSTRDDLPSVLDAVRSGARGYVLKDAPEVELLGAVRAVGRGEAAFGSRVADSLLGHVAVTDPPLPEAVRTLSAREREVLGHLARGLSNGQIALRLHLSAKTVRNNVSLICTKLGVADRVQAALLAREIGL